MSDCQQINKSCEDMRCDECGQNYCICGSPTLKMMNDKQEIANAMVKYGGSFVEALGQALSKADRINTKKIFETWPKYISQYRELAKKDKK